MYALKGLAVRPTRAMTNPRDALADVETAYARTLAVAPLRNVEQIADADRRLRTAITIATDSGVSWGAIGAVVGIARGNAYQRYRRH